MAACHVVMVSISLLLVICSVNSVPVELIEPADHGLANQRTPLAVSPAMLTFFKGTQPELEKPEAIDSATIARASQVTPETRAETQENVSSGGGGRRKGNSAVIAGVVSGVVGLVVVVGAAVGFLVYKRRNEPGSEESDTKALSLVWWNRGSEVRLGSSGP